MKKLLLSMGIAIASIAGITAQDASMFQPLPLNPKVKSGVLPNGLSYYIMHNEEPKERANFYIAQKVGSTLEQPDQLGLAHFLEHMAFNGTTNYPGKNMLNYLQSKGIRFGSDINAYTAFDETVYNIDNVITTDKNLMDSVLLILHDWSGDILLEEAEIDAERGVIQEEWRSRNTADFRMYSEILPKIYQEYQYQQMPIGKMDVVMNFKPEALRAYYKKWYRPDLQGIVIVGDFDADEMEKKVVSLFSTIVMPENAAPREYPAVSDNEKPIFASYADPELTNLMTTISFKTEQVPTELRNSIPMYISESILQPILAQMINNRLMEFAQTPECRYVNASVYFSDFLVSKTKASFNVSVLAKKDSRDAVEDAMSVVTRACKTGFNEAEYERAQQELLANIEKLYNERDKTSNEYFGRELCRFFIDNVPAPGIEQEYQLWQMMLSQLPVQAMNEIAGQLLTDENIVVITSAPKAAGFELVTEDAMLSTLNQVMHAEYEALAEEKITEPLIPVLPAPGKIVSQVEDPSLNAQVITLSNGVKVILKPTDFSADEILMTAYRKGGLQSYETSQANNLKMVNEVYDYAKFGNFDSKTLQKYLAGKNVALNISINRDLDLLTGNSTVKDLPYLFELIYTSFTGLSPDQDAYQVRLERMRPGVENRDKDPMFIFRKHIAETLYGNNPLVSPLNVATLDNAVYSEAFDIMTSTLGNPADYTFVFVGNVNPETIDPLLEQYIASIPAKPATSSVVKTPITITEGQVTDQFNQMMEVPQTMVFNYYVQDKVPYTVENDIMISFIGDILGNIFTDTLREEEGGTYSPFASATYDQDGEQAQINYIFFTNAEQQEKLRERANEELMNLLNNGVDEANFNKVKEAALKQFEINSRKNGYWMGTLMVQSLYPQVEYINTYGEALNGLTRQQLNDFMKNLYNGQNRIQVVLEGVPAK